MDPLQDQTRPPTEREALRYLVDRVREDPKVVARRLQTMVAEAVMSPLRQQYEREASLQYLYAENEFYTEEELAQLQERGQPPVKRNEMVPVLERIAGQFIQTRMTATFVGRNTPADDAVGAVAQDYLRYVDQCSQFEFEEQEAVWHGLIGGVGWIKCQMRRNELGQWEQHDRAVDPFTIYVDPYSQRFDPNDDAKYIVEGRWMDVEDLIALLPEQEATIRDEVQQWGTVAAPSAGLIDRALQNEASASSVFLGLSMQEQQGRRRIRPFEIWYKRKVRTYYILGEDGVTVLPVPLDAAAMREVRDELASVSIKQMFQDRLYVGVLLGNTVLHHDVSPHWTNRFPYVPFYSGRRKNGTPLALAARLVPICEAINKRESKSLALLTNRQVIYEGNAIEDEEEFARELAKPDGRMRVREGALAGPGGPRIIIRDNLDIGMAQLQLLQEDKDSMRRVSGHGNESMGMPSEVRSGVGIARKQMMSNLIVTPLHNYVRRFRLLRAKLTFEYMKQYLTEGITFQLTDDPNAARTVQMTSGHLNALRERIYDIVITETKDYATLREQQAEMLLTVLPQLAQGGSWLVRLGIELSDLRNKEGLLRMIDATQQPAPAVPKVSLALNWADLTAEEKAALSLLLWQSPELAQAIMERGDDPAFLQRLKADLIKTQIKEGTRATIERGRVDLQALQTAMEGRLRVREFLERMGRRPEPVSQPGMEPEAESTPFTGAEPTGGAPL